MKHACCGELLTPINDMRPRISLIKELRDMSGLPLGILNEIARITAPIAHRWMCMECGRQYIQRVRRTKLMIVYERSLLWHAAWALELGLPKKLIQQAIADEVFYHCAYRAANESLNE